MQLFSSPLTRLMRTAGVIAVVACVPSLVRAQATTSTPTPVTQVVGTVTDSASHAPLRLATVRVSGGTASVLTDDAGRFQLTLPPGALQLDVRRLGYRPGTITLAVGDTTMTVSIALSQIPASLSAVVSTGDDDAARRIIEAAIRRKQERRGSLHDYRYEAHVRIVVLPDWSKSAPPKAGAKTPQSGDVMGETVTSAYWEQPDHFQQRILARRETANFDAERNLIGAGEIEDFSRDRIPAGRNLLVSPIADDALDLYRFRVLDTLSVEGRRVFRLSLEPSSDRLPAFAGTIDIVDSTFDVAGFDVGVNAATDVGPIRDFRYRQDFGDAGGGRWMPRQISVTGAIDSPIPFFRKDGLSFDYTAALDSFRFNEGAPPAGLGEYRIIVDDDADRPDTATWAHAPALPPQAPVADRHGDPRDSAAYGPLAMGGVRLREAVAAVQSLDLLHFNRVDGWYFGAGWTWRDLAATPWMVPTARVGYATGSDRWEYRFGDQFRLSEPQRMWIGVLYHDETITRPGFASNGYNPSLRAVVIGPGADGLDYYRERGSVTSFSTKLVDLTQLDLAFTDANQSSLAILPRYVTPDTGRRAAVPNPPIEDGVLRSLTASVTYDSRAMIHQRGEDQRIPTATGTRVWLGAEVSSPSVLGSDFQYQRYTIRAMRNEQFGGWGITSFNVAAGVGSDALPPQRYLSIDGGARIFQTTDVPFSTLGDSVFVGNRAAVISVDQHFGRTLFLRSGIPGIRDLPFTFGLHAGVFWTSFDGPGTPARDSLLTSHGAPYKEVGFTLGNLTPFLGIFDLAFRTGFQLSNFPTGRVRFGIGFGGQ